MVVMQSNEEIMKKFELNANECYEALIARMLIEAKASKGIVESTIMGVSFYVSQYDTIESASEKCTIAYIKSKDCKEYVTNSDLTKSLQHRLVGY